MMYLWWSLQMGGYRWKGQYYYDEASTFFRKMEAKDLADLGDHLPLLFHLDDNLYQRRCHQVKGGGRSISLYIINR